MLFFRSKPLRTWVLKRIFIRHLSLIKPERRVFSGIQPTGSIHLGNYYGAVEKWISLQKETNCVFSIVDLHSLTFNHNPKKLSNDTTNMLSTLLACGLDPQKCILFLQSQVPEHSELCWILTCLMTMARLKHQPQFKEKSATLKDIPMGLFLYPVLQSADILAYKATEVPVGEDQLQHIQLAQHLCHAFNNKYSQIFPIPEPIIDNSAACRLKSLRNPSKKMSKSDPDPKSRVELTDSNDEILGKLKKALTDFTSAVTYDPVERPAISNIIFIHSLVTKKSIEEICRESEGLETAKYKLIVADALIEKFNPIRQKIIDYSQNKDYLSEVLKMGREKARQISGETLKEVKNALGVTS